MKKTILVTGSAGYIGSIAVELLLKEGFNVISLDDLSTGHRESLFKEAKFYEGKVGDKSLLKKIFTENQIDCVLHIAGAALVEESMTNPSKYFDINFTQGNIMLESMLEHNVNKIVFSSTCAIYGIPDGEISEDDIKCPINPYGESKLAFEESLSWYKKNKNLNFIALRYFNVAGASENRGELHNPETHLIPLILKAGKNDNYKFKVFGNDYNTKDGTTIRDYVHVVDLNRAHIISIKALLEKKNPNNFYNLGSGVGYSILEIINATEKALGKKIPYTVSDRRPGDPPILIANSSKIKKELNWHPMYENIEETILSAKKFIN